MHTHSTIMTQIHIYYNQCSHLRIDNLHTHIHIFTIVCVNALCGRAHQQQHMTVIDAHKSMRPHTHTHTHTLNENVAYSLW